MAITRAYTLGDLKHLASVFLKYIIKSNLRFQNILTTHIDLDSCQEVELLFVHLLAYLHLQEKSIPITEASIDRFIDSHDFIDPRYPIGSPINPIILSVMKNRQLGYNITMDRENFRKINALLAKQLAASPLQLPSIAAAPGGFSYARIGSPPVPAETLWEMPVVPTAPLDFPRAEPPPLLSTPAVSPVLDIRAQECILCIVRILKCLSALEKSADILAKIIHFCHATRTTLLELGERIKQSNYSTADMIVNMLRDIMWHRLGSLSTITQHHFAKIDIFLEHIQQRANRHFARGHTSANPLAQQTTPLQSPVSTIPHFNFFPSDPNEVLDILTSDPDDDNRMPEVVIHCRPTPHHQLMTPMFEQLSTTRKDISDNGLNIPPIINFLNSFEAELQEINSAIGKDNKFAYTTANKLYKLVRQSPAKFPPDFTPYLEAFEGYLEMLKNSLPLN